MCIFGYIFISVSFSVAVGVLWILPMHLDCDPFGIFLFYLEAQMNASPSQNKFAWL